MFSEWPARTDRGGQRTLIEIIEFASNRHAVGKPRDGYPGAFQQIGDVMGSGLTIHGGVHRQHHLGDAARLHPCDQPRNVEVVRTDAIKR